MKSISYHIDYHIKFIFNDAIDILQSLIISPLPLGEPNVERGTMQAHINRIIAAMNWLHI